jgi:hypothetical protein
VPSIHAANPELPRALDPVFRRALSKDPRARPATAADLVAELRQALHDDAGDTWLVPTAAAAPVPTAVTRVDERRRGTGRRRPWVIAALVALLVAAGIAAAVVATRDSHSARRTPPPQPVTILRTITQPGQTVELTTTAPAPPPAPAPTTEAAASTFAATTSAATTGSQLNAAGYAKMQAGDYAGALPLLEQAVQQLHGAGSLDEAYADYNLAYTRYELGDCTDVLTLLDQSQAIQGHRPEIAKLRHDAQKACG